MDGEKWCTSTKQLQVTLLQVCEVVRRIPGELRNSGAATLQFVWNVEHDTQHTTNVFFNENASLGEYARRSIEVQYQYADQGGDVLWRMTLYRCGRTIGHFDSWRIYCDGSSTFSVCVSSELLRDRREGRTPMAWHFPV